MLNIVDFQGERTVRGEAELVCALRRRSIEGENSVNLFWLDREGQHYPHLGIMVNGPLATVFYMPREGHPGFRSLGPVPGLDPDGVTLFWISTIDGPDEHLNSFVIRVEAAEEAAKAFMRTPALPSSLEWFEL